MVDWPAALLLLLIVDAVLVYALLFRLRRLKTGGRVPASVSTASGTAVVWGFVFTTRHRELGDRPVTVLVVASRALLVLILPMMLFHLAKYVMYLGFS